MGRKNLPTLCVIFDIFKRVQITEFMRVFPGFEEKSAYFSKNSPPNPQKKITYFLVTYKGMWLVGWVTGETGIKAKPNKSELELTLALSSAIRLC